MDVKSTGPQFTWINGRSERSQIRERLVNEEWISLFPRALIQILPRCASDHAPILLDTVGAGPKPFRFESCWTREPKSLGVVEKAWKEPVWGSASYRLIQKIKETARAFQVWNRDVFGNVQLFIKRLNDQLVSVQGLPPSDQTWEAESRLRSDLLEALRRK